MIENPQEKLPNNLIQQSKASEYNPNQKCQYKIDKIYSIGVPTHQKINDHVQTKNDIKINDQNNQQIEEQLKMDQNPKFRWLKCISYFCNFFQYKKSTSKHVQSKQKQQESQFYIHQKSQGKSYIHQNQQPNKKKSFSMQIKAQRSFIRLKNKTDIPAMLTIHAGTSNQRNNIDIICVIDTSGSMSGTNLKNVKIAMEYLIKILNDQDRINIVTFNDEGFRKSSFLYATEQNKDQLNRIVNKLSAEGGTDIYKGIQQALKILKKQGNPKKITSLLLLSDGQNVQSLENVIMKIKTFQVQNKIPRYTINTFGFGLDHDENLMFALSRHKNGNFYFIKQLDKLDEAFCLTLGSLISVNVKQIKIKLKVVASGLASKIKIKKTYGKDWQKVENNCYEIKLSQMSSQLSRDFIFQLQIPYINDQVGDFQRQQKIIQGFYSVKNLKNQLIEGQCCLKLTFLNNQQKIIEPVQNPQIIENLLRVKAAQTIQDCLKKADKQKYKQAEKDLDAMLELIKSNRKARKQKLVQLITDLQRIKLKCSRNAWKEDGRKDFMSSYQIYEQQSNQYNFSQKNMTVEMITQKKKKNKKANL